MSIMSWYVKKRDKKYVYGILSFVKKHFIYVQRMSSEGYIKN